jgi:hypothetical protein
MEDDYFLQVDSGGSKPELTPPANKGVTPYERLGNVGEYTLRLSEPAALSLQSHA